MMTKEEKQLLLIELCERLPYGVFINTAKGDGTLDTIQVCCNNDVICSSEKRHEIIDCVKPYLRPMLSMTEEEKIEFESLGWRVDELDDNEPWFHDAYNEFEGVDWLNKKMFDYRGLIPMGLALEATKDMYKNE